MARINFYDLNVHTVPEGKNTIKEMAVLAKRLGYAGIAITNPSESCRPEKSSLLDGTEILSGVELKAGNGSQLHGLVGKYRHMADIIVVHGGNESINRSAVENPNVDILSCFGSIKDNGLNHVLARSASDNDVALCFDLGEIICHKGGRRVRALSNFRKNLQLIRRYDVPFVLTANAESVYDLRAPRELMALAGLFGMTQEEAVCGLSAIPERILSKNRPSSGYVSEGVEIVDEITYKGEGQ